MILGCVKGGSYNKEFPASPPLLVYLEKEIVWSLGSLFQTSMRPQMKGESLSQNDWKLNMEYPKLG
jgi:hypothetical protein